MGKEKFMTIERSEELDLEENQVKWIQSNLPKTEKLKNILSDIEKDPNNPKLRLEKGEELRKAQLFRQAIDAFSEAIYLDPFYSLAYRHRGHRFLSIGMFREGAADLELSSRIDPNNWDTWYHLGLSYYLLKDYERAERAYGICYNMSDSDELFVAIIDWYWMTLMKNGKEGKAASILSKVTEDMDPGPNSSYHRRLLMYKGLIKPEELINYDGASIPDLELATQGYGLGFYYLTQGNIEKAHEIFKEVLEKSTQWAAFGYLASEVELGIIK